MRSRLVWVAVLASAAWLAAPDARAQEVGGVALNQLEPSPAGDAFFGVASPFIGGHLVPRALALVDHAAEPLVLSTATSSTAIVARQTTLHVDVSLALWDRLRADVLLPVALAQGGGTPEGPANAASPPLPAEARGEAPALPGGPLIGDLRLGLRVRLIGADEAPFQLAFGALLHVPTGKSGAYVGEGAVRDTPYIALGGRTPWLVWSATVGACFRASTNPSTLTYGAAAGLLLADGMVQVGPELYAATPLQGGRLAVSSLQRVEREALTNAEALLSARVRLPAGFSAGIGGGLGLSEAIGTPAFRLIGGLGWELPARGGADARDTDADGIADGDDACPYAFGPEDADPKRRGCPAPDGEDDAPPADGASADRAGP